MFEIKAKDNMGRVGVLKTKHGDVKTPALMPVIHPRKQAIDVGKYGADIVITNAYLIYKDEILEQAWTFRQHRSLTVKRLKVI